VSAQVQADVGVFDDEEGTGEGEEVGVGVELAAC